MDVVWSQFLFYVPRGHTPITICLMTLDAEKRCHRGPDLITVQSFFMYRHHNEIRDNPIIFPDVSVFTENSGTKA
jgi:hypothetical protein